MQAIEAEKQIKSWSRFKKQALIAGNWQELKRLAECRNETTSKRLRPGYADTSTGARCDGSTK